jgi:exonuclease VII small subunit
MQAPLATDAQGPGAKQRSVARDWIGAQLQRAARTARTLEPARLVPLRVPRGVSAGLLAGLVVLAIAWSAPPLAPAHSRSAEVVETPENARVRELRELVEALPQGDAARRLQAALSTLESGSASPQQRRQALAQAQDAVDQIRLDAAASREGLQRLSEMLAGQEGLEEVAQALAQGDAKRAAELLAKVEAGQRAAGSGNAPDPSETVGERPLDQGLQALTDAMAEPQGGRPTSETLQMTVDRLEQIARELAAANYVNEAWREVKGPQLQAARGTNMTAGRFDQQQSTGASNPSPSTGDTPMGGGTMFRSAAVAQGPGMEEQEGGTRAGDAIGDAPPDPVLGEAGERLDAQLKQQGLTGQEEQLPDQEDQAWFYAQSQKREARSAWRDVQARARFAEADAGTAGGISIRHRQIVKDYFMNRPEAAQ